MKRFLKRYWLHILLVLVTFFLTRHMMLFSLKIVDVQQGVVKIEIAGNTHTYEYNFEEEVK